MKRSRAFASALRRCPSGKGSALWLFARSFFKQDQAGHLRCAPIRSARFALLIALGIEGGCLSRNVAGFGILDPFTQRPGRDAQIAGDFALPASTEDERNGLFP